MTTSKISFKEECFISCNYMATVVDNNNRFSFELFKYLFGQPKQKHSSTKNNW